MYYAFCEFIETSRDVQVRQTVPFSSSYVASKHAKKEARYCSPSNYL